MVDKPLFDMERFGEGDRVRVDIPDENDPDHAAFHGVEGRVITVQEDAASDYSGDERDSVSYRVELDSGKTMDFRWRDLRPPIDEEIRTVNIDVTCDADGEGGIETFGVATEHRPDLPKPFDEQLQEWVRKQFEDQLESGETIESAAVMEYVPNGEIIEFRK